MDAKQAAKIAKAYVATMLEDENITNLGLEEIDYNNGFWDVTVGFSRPWNTYRNPLAAITGAGDSTIRRAYRIIKIDNETENVLSMKRRDAEQ
ncbi:hypothetical protein [Labrys wisconsinensis]|uniref:Pyruvate/2-oxoglutarate/acetoin dehydrogenase E1 component n=1 Tax=Labrys wisconsinensis TaxID=425677 RepID=A0ABU0J2Y9_9HYPH|nr:hypothetical protein [Labrys wisconsinensis]MDQ0467985.1 pyruvate/2-oxoglutarate/acetoin dehydrogenase E1 component [Labrys wisconsinensis]